MGVVIELHRLGEIRHGVDCSCLLGVDVHHHARRGEGHEGHAWNSENIAHNVVLHRLNTTATAVAVRDTPTARETKDALPGEWGFRQQNCTEFEVPSRHERRNVMTRSIFQECRRRVRTAAADQTDVAWSCAISSSCSAVSQRGFLSLLNSKSSVHRMPPRVSRRPQ